MSPIGVDKGLTSGSHGAHQAVDSGHVDGGPDLPDGLLQLGCGRWPRLEGIQLPLHNVPQVFNGIHIRAQRGPGHHPDVVLLQEGCGGPRGVGASVVLLKGKVAVELEVRYDCGPQDLVDITLCIYAVSAPRADALEDHGAHKMVEAYPTPDHDAGASPGVVLQDVVGGVPLVASSPHPDAAVRVADAVAAFVRKKDVPPLPLVPVEVLMSPLQSLLPVLCSKQCAASRAPAVQVVC